MTAAQGRIADTLETFYGAADQTSEGAMAGHAYKRSVDDLDQGIGRELVGSSMLRVIFTPGLSGVCPLGRPIPHYYHGTPGQDECVLPGHQRTYLETQQEGELALPAAFKLAV